MSTDQNINQPHKCIATKCKGLMLEPRENYGYWAYWHGNGKTGWHSKPEGTADVPVDSTAVHQSLP